MWRTAQTEWGRFKDRCLWSSHGVVEVWRAEPSFRFWTALNVLSAVCVVALGLGALHAGLILGAGLLVLAAELLNSGIERAVDRISQDTHPLAKAAKDAGSAGVAMTAIAAGVLWVFVLIDHLGG